MARRDDQDGLAPGHLDVPEDGTKVTVEDLTACCSADDQPSICDSQSGQPTTDPDPVGCQPAPVPANTPRDDGPTITEIDTCDISIKIKLRQASGDWYVLSNLPMPIESRGCSSAS